MLLVNGELRVTDNVDEENVGDFQLNFFFNQGRHMDSHGNARREDTLKQADESRAQSEDELDSRPSPQFRAKAVERWMFSSDIAHTMARLHEYQGKAILAANGFKIPGGRAASNGDGAVAAAKELGGEVVIKIQAWTTGRAGIGGVAFAKKPDDVRGHATRMLAMKVGQFPVEAVLVEEKVDIDREFFLSFAIDDAARAPMIIFAAGGGSWNRRTRRLDAPYSLRCQSRTS